MASTDYYNPYGEKPRQAEFGTTIVDYPANNTLAGNEFSADMNNWDEWMQWDNAPDVVNPSALIQKSGMLTDFGVPNQQWQAGPVEQAGSFMLNDMDMQDSPFELDTPVLSPISPTEGSMRSSSGSPIERTIQDFHMGVPAVSNNKSTASSSTENTSSTSSSKQAPPKATRGRGKRRKTSNLNEADLHQSRKRGHNAIEKRYRTNLNYKIIALRDSIPNTRTLSGDDSVDEDGDGGQGAQKFGKAAILTRAVEYIQYLEECTKRMGAETNALKGRVLAFEKLAMSGSGVSDLSSYSFVDPAETLESIQAEFLQNVDNNKEEKPLAATPTSPANKRRNSSKKM